MKSIYVLFAYVLLIAFDIVISANILYLSAVPSLSHFLWCKSILVNLHENGHNITALSPDVEASHERFFYYHLEKVYSFTEINILEMGKTSITDILSEFYDSTDSNPTGPLYSNGYKQLLDYPEDFKFDLIIHDFTMGQCLLGLVHKFKYPPMVSVSPVSFTGLSTLISGSPAYPAFYPPVDLSFSANLDFLQRVRTTLSTMNEIIFMNMVFLPKVNRLVRKFHPDAPSVLEIEVKATKLILMNTNPITDYRQPSFPHVKLVGGAQIKKPNSLPSELQKIVDEAESVVLFSLGTNVKSEALGEERILKILKAFTRLPRYTFLWKLETKAKLPIELPSNVKIQSWIPQNDILAQPKTKLFISHCGLLSTQESLFYGVPILCFPIIFDQHQNSFRMKELRVGEHLRSMTLLKINSMRQPKKCWRKIKVIRQKSKN